MTHDPHARTVAGDTDPAATPIDSELERLGRYRVDSKLGGGGFGTVYRGYDEELDRVCAIKVLHPQQAANTTEAFLKEARQLASLHHPNIVTVYDVGVDEDRCFIVTEFLDGPDLEKWLAQYPRPPWQQSVQILEKIADALIHAHQKPVVHRDVKPQNIILVDNATKPVLVDFGLAVTEADNPEASLGLIAGTPAYMSPEQAQGRAHTLDGRTDIYSLGVVLYRMLTGQRPFLGPEQHALLRQIREDPPVPPRQRFPEIPQLLEDVCLRAMSKRPADRYSNSFDFRQALLQTLSEPGAFGGPGSAPGQPSAGYPPQNVTYPPSHASQAPPYAPQYPSQAPSHSQPVPPYPLAPSQAPGAPQAPPPSQEYPQAPIPSGAAEIPPVPPGYADTQDISGQLPPYSMSGDFSVAGSPKRKARGEERRQVTVVLFVCDLNDEEQTLEELDPEVLLELNEAFHEVCRNAIQSFEGSLVEEKDNKVRACYGFPIGFEDSAQNAVRSGLAILEEMPKLNERLKDVHDSGLSASVTIHSGLAVVKEENSETDSPKVSVTGQASSITDRVCEDTDPDSVVITAATHKLTGGYFVCEKVGSRKLKGSKKPLDLFEVTAESDARDRVETGDPERLTPLVGRDSEMTSLKDHWDDALEGEGQIVLLIGEAGLGKSRLLHTLRQHVKEESDDEVTIIDWRCTSHHRTSGLYAATDYFSRALNFARDDSPKARLDRIDEYCDELDFGDKSEVAPLLASLLSIPMDDRYPPLEMPPQVQKQRTLELLLDWLDAQRERQPVLFIVEDLHWIDPSTIDLLTQLVDAGPKEQLLSILTFRPEFETPWGSRAYQSQIALKKLRKRQINEMIQLTTGIKDPPTFVVEQIAARTGGVPLFVEEFSKMVHETGGFEVVDGDVSVSRSFSVAGVPDSLKDLLIAKLDRMDCDPEVVQVAATIGREFTLELLSAVVEPETAATLDAELQKLVDSEVVTRQGRPPNVTYQFKHALIVDAVYDSLLSKKKQLNHQRIGDALERQFPETVEAEPEVLADHFTEAGNVEQAVAYWQKAGQRSQTRSANAEAISHLTRGLELLATLDESPERDQLELGFQLTLAPVLMAARGWSAPEVGTAIERAQQLVAKYGTVEDQFFVKWGLWGWRIIRADMDICAEIAAETMQLVESSPDAAELMPEAYWVVGCTAYYKGDFRNGLDLLEKGLPLIDDERERGYALKTGQVCSSMLRSHIPLALWELGYPDQALQRSDEMVRLAKELEHPFTYAMALFFNRQVLEYCGQRDRARAAIEQEYKVCHDNGFVFFEVHAVFGRGNYLLREGKADEARELFDQGLKMLHATGGNLSMDHPFRNIAEAFLQAGLLDDAKEWLKRGFDLVNRHHARMESEFLRLQGELVLAGGDQARAEQCYQKALDVARQQQAKSWELRTMISFGELRHRQGKSSEAGQLLESVYSWFGEGFETSDLIRAKSLLAEFEAQA